MTKTEDDVEVLWAAYQINCHKARAQLDARGSRKQSRRKLLAERIKVYGLEICIAATRGWVHDPWEDRVLYLSPEQVFHAGNIERFSEWDLDGPPRRLTKTDRINLEVGRWAAAAEQKRLSASV